MAGMRYQPQGLLRIDRANGLARGLRLVSMPGVNGGTDLASGAAASVTGTRRATYPGGLTCGFGSALGVNGADRIATPFTGALVERSVFVRARRNGNGGVNVGRLYDKSVGTAGQMAYWDANAQALTYHMFVNGSERLVRAPGSAAAASVGRDFDILITHAFAGNRSTVNIYVDGGLAITQDIDGAVTDAPTTVLSIGNRGDGIRGWDGSIALVEAWDRVLTADEARELSTNPWQVFAAVDDDDYAAASIARTLTVGRASLALGAGQVGMRVSRRVRVQSAALAIKGEAIAARVARRMTVQSAGLTIGAGPARMLTARRLGVQPAALAVAGQGVAVPVGRRMQIAQAPLSLTAGQVTMQYSPAPVPGAYTLPVSAAAMMLGGGTVGMRVSRRLRVAGAQMQIGTADVRFHLRRAPASIDMSWVSLSRIVRFESSGSRLVIFEGCGSRVVVFEGSGKRMRFNQMSAKVPTKVGEKWTVDRDRDEISYHAADITDELADRNTTPVEKGVVALVHGVVLLEGPELQTATVDGAERTFVVVKLGGVEGELPDDWRWVARVSCANGERFDKTTWFNEVDP